MSKFNESTLDYSDFSRLDEETETDGDIARRNGDADTLQPHLSLPPPPSTGARRNGRERGVVVLDDEPKDGDISKPSQEETPAQAENDQTFVDRNSNHVANNHQSNVEHDYTPNTSTSIAADITSESNDSVGRTTTKPNSIQIYYNKHTDNVTVREGQAISGENRSRYIATQQIPPHWDDDEIKPLRKKRIYCIKIFSIIACFLFFPTGIPAAYFAFRIDREFEEGILRGNIDRALKFAERCHRLIVLSVAFCILVAFVVAIAFVEEPHFQSNYHYGGATNG